MKRRLRALHTQYREARIFPIIALCWGVLVAFGREAFDLAGLWSLSVACPLLMLPSGLGLLAVPFSSYRRSGLILCAGVLGSFAASPLSWRIAYGYWFPTVLVPF